VSQGSLQSPSDLDGTTQEVFLGATTESGVVVLRGTPVVPSQTKDEAAIAAAIAPSSQDSASDEAERAKRTDPHGPASALP
jgi:hypothetical protein